MCGIFAYVGHQPIPIIQALKVLHILENEQESGEKSPVGGHGAGIAYLNQKGTLTLTKLGKTKNKSPVNDLQFLLGKAADNSSCLILGHVRRSSPEFIDTIQHKECTQPYRPTCIHNLSLVSAHNGKVQNYLELRNRLKQPHKFESQKIKLIDSEVIPHLFEGLLKEHKDPTKATHALFEHIQGSDTQGNTVVLIHTKQKQAHLNVIQKGRTRGLVIWTNTKGEVLLCSRQQPTEKILHKLITKNSFQKTIKVNRTDSVNIETHFTLTLPETT